MAGEITVKFSTQMSLVRRQLTKIGDDLKDELAQETKFIAEETAFQLRETTPGLDLPLGWKVVPLPTTGAASRFAITNVDPRANKPVGRGSTRTLLDILEFGFPGGYLIKGNPLLAFFWEKKGINVVVRSVTHPGVVHPGVAPGFFIRPAIAEAKRKQADVSRRLAKRVKQGLV